MKIRKWSLHSCPSTPRSHQDHVKITSRSRQDDTLSGDLGSDAYFPKYCGSQEVQIACSALQCTVESKCHQRLFNSYYSPTLYLIYGITAWFHHSHHSLVYPHICHATFISSHPSLASIPESSLPVYFLFSALILTTELIFFCPPPPWHILKTQRASKRLKLDWCRL